MQLDNTPSDPHDKPNKHSDASENIVGRDMHIHGDEVRGDKVDGDKITADNRGVAASEVNNSNVVTGDGNSVSLNQYWATTVKLGPLNIPKPIAVLLLVGFSVAVILIGSIALYSRGTFQAITAVPTETPFPTATPLAFATQTVSETLIVVATFHNTAATNSEAHTKIRRAIAAEAANHNEQLRVEVEPTILTADQRTEAEALGNRYNASMVIWGEDTGVEVIVNFLNLQEPKFDAAAATITEQERTQLASPSAYAGFITQNLPQTMSFLTFFAVGQSYSLNERYISAIERIEAAVALVQSDSAVEGLPEAYFRLGWLYQIITPTDLDKAIANYNQAIQLGLNNATVYYNRALALAAQGNWKGAIDDFYQTIRRDPNSANAYYNRGLAYKAQGDLNQAVADFDQAIQLAPNSAVIYYNRGLTYKVQGKLDDEIADFSHAIHLDPNSAVAHYNRGLAYKVQGKLEEAIKDYGQAIQLGLDSAVVYYNRGLALTLYGDLDGAIVDLDQAIRLDPNYTDAYYNRGLAYKVQGKLEEAIKDYDQAIQLDPHYTNAFWGRGLAYRNLERPKEALADFRRYLELQPNATNRAQVESWIAEAEAELAKAE